MSGGEEETPNVEESAASTNDEQQNESTEASGNGEGSGAGDVAIPEEKASSDEYIRLRVITSDMTNEVHFRVKSATALGRLKRSYCSKLGFQVEELRFVFDGHRITDDDTPKKLGMMNDDVIEIYQERTGGK
ncbi:small ubiquitin-related modifier-like [Adelges cooleyi]|uniref:small ubiquitin-related modifier-like n=1 Tax=Adelges cooleyi TaxID=133065 RepID=UPI00217FB73D|nr:small ubiquitin-related modifier-like [Adelges cooleyi]